MKLHKIASSFEAPAKNGFGLPYGIQRAMEPAPANRIKGVPSLVRSIFSCPVLRPLLVGQMRGNDVKSTEEY